MFPDLFLNVYPFSCCQLRFPDETRLVMENWKRRIAFSESGFICQQCPGRTEESARLSLLGGPWVSRQTAALGRAGAFQSRGTEFATCMSKKLLIPYGSAKLAKLSEEVLFWLAMKISFGCSNIQLVCNPLYF